MDIATKEIIDRLDSIQAELDYIKEHMIDVDSILTEEDKKDIEQAKKELGKGKTTSFEDLKKELGF